jgi:hypothetical protein
LIQRQLRGRRKGQLAELGIGNVITKDFAAAITIVNGNAAGRGRVKLSVEPKVTKVPVELMLARKLKSFLAASTVV